MSGAHSKQSKGSIFSRFIAALHSLVGSATNFFKSNIDGLRTLWRHGGKTSLTNIGTVFSVFIALLDGLILYKAKNKNLGKSFDFFYSMLQATPALLTLAAIFAKGTIFVIAGSAIALNIAYSLGGLVYSFYKYRTYAKETTVESLNIRRVYKNAMIKYAVGLILSLVALAAFLVFSAVFSAAFPAVVKAASLSVGVVAAIFLLGQGIYGFYSLFHSVKFQSKKHERVTEVLDVSSNMQQQVSALSLETKDTFFVNVYKKNNEYYQANIRLTQLTGDLDEDRETLILEAYKSILRLEKEIFDNKAKELDFFKFNEKPKRLKKLDFYKKSLVLLLPTSPKDAVSYLRKIDRLYGTDTTWVYLHTPSIYKFIEELSLKGKCTEFGKYYSELHLKLFLSELETSTYQSFFKSIGNVETFIEALKAYFEKSAKCKAQEESSCVPSPLGVSSSP